MPISYQFLPWVRRGLTVALDSVETLGELPARATAHVGIRLAGPHAGADIAPIAMQLHGPGDVVGIDTRLVVRTDPRPGTTNFEPNYLAMIDFDPPDLPWMLTPARANGDERLRPWLVLVVLDVAKVGRPRMQAQAPLPQIRVGAPDVVNELPALDESWSWAHAQIVSEAASDDVNGIQADLQKDPRSNLSRLVCPRRLKPNTEYVACVVPAFEPGRLRGLGLAGDGNAPAMQTLAPAWNTNANRDVVLPVYHHWEFSTGPAGDFEYLARRLRSPKKWKNDPTIGPLLSGVGTAPMAVDDLLNGDTPGLGAMMEGALVPISYTPGAAAHATQVASLEVIVDTPAGQVDNPVVDEPDGSVRRIEVKPPIYGAWHAMRHSVTSPQAASYWLAGLNLNPRYRGAAGYGSEVVRKYQEDYVDACWDQVGAIREAEMKFNLTRLAIEVQSRLKAKHFDALPAERLLQVMAPALSRIEAISAQGVVTYEVNGKTASLRGQIDRSSLPAALLDGAMRRSASPQRRALRLAALRSQRLEALPALSAHYVQTMAAASMKPAMFAVNAFVPDGVLGTRLFDGVRLDGAGDERLDLTDCGLHKPLSVSQVRSVLNAADKARQGLRQGDLPLPKIRPGQSGGIFTDLHVERFGTLLSSSNSIGIADLGLLARQVQTLGRRGVEGFLIEAQRDGGHFQLSAMRLDARSGAIHLDRPLVRFDVRRAPVDPSPADQARASGLSLGSITPGDARRFSNLGLFASLPPNAIDLQGGNSAVKFKVGVGGQLERIGEAPPERNVVSVTLPPSLRQREVLSRFSQATRGVQQAWRDPFERARVNVQTVDFPLAQAAQIVQARTVPELTLRARLVSQISIAEAAFGTLSSHVGTHLGSGALSSKLRFAIPALFDRVMAFPHLREPMYRALSQYDQEAFMPGIGNLPPDLIMLVQVNQFFIDSFMVGANFEMNRELLWRGFPTDLRGTPFQRFWGRLRPEQDGSLTPLDDMEPIHEWAVQPLGKRADANLTDPDRVALLIKGQLLRRYPNTSVYAWKRRKNVPADQSKLLKNAQGLPPNPKTDIQTPVFVGFIAPDITFFGFDIDRADVGDWCFVVEEQMSEPRFGFDVEDPVPAAEPGTPAISVRPRAALQWARGEFSKGAGASPEFKAMQARGYNAWKTLSWSHIQVAGGAHLSIAALAALGSPANAPFASFPALTDTPTAGEIAKALLQQPFRAYWEGPDLIT